MKVKSEVVGGVVTSVYLVGVAVLVYWKRASLPGLELNAIGDFLAGVFGPIAFLWLVLGYLQQGRELKLSSEALQLQAQELKNSVDQQKEMVGIAGRQLETELENVRYAREIAEYESRPNIKFSARVPTANMQSMDVYIKIENIGKNAESVIVVIGNANVYNGGAIAAGKSVEFHVPLDKATKDYSFSVKYSYGIGKEVVDNYIMKVKCINGPSGIAKIGFDRAV
ncbi:hypothetical protein [Pseudomonas sp. R76]|uniref:hypothetical protein n=1 Tax=Pseudomonas sp. R76 TaxID=1573711 RepID=UPI00135C0A85|nr:hypothetical protein [Pseudomonas sp. R76]